jgi:hypothetical protein
MYTILKPLLGAIVVAGAFNAAQAASLGYLDHLGYGAYNAVTGATSETDALGDLSTPPSQVTLVGANSFETPVPGGTLSHSYAADAFIDFSAPQTDLWMSLSHSLATNAGSAFNVAFHRQDVAIDLGAVRMRVLGDAGEAPGSAVMVSFTGNASALTDFSSVVNGSYLTLGLSVLRGDAVLGEYLWDVQSSADQNLQFSFAGQVGDALTLSAFIVSGVALDNASFGASANPITLAEGFGAINGSFTVAAVPEPETFALLLAGLGVVGFQVRRRRNSHRH